MIEVEVKLRLKNSPEETLLQLGFCRGDVIRESDTYLDDRKQSIRMDGEALRIREIQSLTDDRSQAVITFKGKKLDRVTMTRKELETEVGSAVIAEQLLAALGYRAVEPRVVKTREHYHRRNMNVCLDHVEGLGDFLELELVIPEDQDQEKAMEEIEDVMESLGYDMTDSITNSYLSMLQGLQD